MSSQRINGSQILLRKLPIYLQCKEHSRFADADDTLVGFVQGSSERETDRHRLRGGDEGSQLLGDPSTYGLLALSRGIQEVLLYEREKSSSLFSGEDENGKKKKKERKGTSPPFFSPESQENLFRLADALSQPFREIHVHMSSTLGRHESFGNQKNSEIHSPLSASHLSSSPEEIKSVAQQTEDSLLDAALSLPALTEVIYPLAATRSDAGHFSSPLSKKRKRSDNAFRGFDSFIDEDEVNKGGKKICRYGSSILAGVYAYSRSAESQHIIHAIRHTEGDTVAVSGISASVVSSSVEAEGLRRFRDAYDDRLQPLMEHILSTSNSSSSFSPAASPSTRQERDDEATVQAYLKRFLWIASQTRRRRGDGASPDSSPVSWEDKTESERVEAEMKHVVQQRARFSRPRSSSSQRR